MMGRVKIICLLVLGGLFVMFMPFTILHIGMLLQTEPSEPKIKYGEFPFKLVYEINGEEKMVGDTLICEYIGIDVNAGMGKYRKWDSHLESGKNKTIISKSKKGEGKTHEIYFYPEIGRLYMGDLNEDDDTSCFEQDFPNIFYSEIFIDGTEEGGRIRNDELLERFNIKLISWEIAPPIENSFR